MNERIEISVVIPTAGRPQLLRQSLESLAEQELSPRAFEVIVIEDGPGDRAPYAGLARDMRLQVHQIASSGIAAAKNLGLFAASAPIVLFFDDDDLAAPSLLSEHLAAHADNPSDGFAVLGHTTWASHLDVTEVMRYVTDIGYFLFAYPLFRAGEVLDYTAFWGGRTSCKRMLLAQHGIFDTAFRFGGEDVELGYRLTRFGLKVLYHPAARSYMNRPITFDEFCNRCERQGRSQHRFGRILHPNSEVHAYTEVLGAEARWQEAASGLGAAIEQVRELEQVVEGRGDGAQTQRDELWAMYRHVFHTFRAKGIVDAARDGTNRV